MQLTHRHLTVMRHGVGLRGGPVVALVCVMYDSHQTHTCVSHPDAPGCACRLHITCLACLEHTCRIRMCMQGDCMAGDSGGQPAFLSPVTVSLTCRNLSTATRPAAPAHHSCTAQLSHWRTGECSTLDAHKVSLTIWVNPERSGASNRRAEGSIIGVATHRDETTGKRRAPALTTDH